MKTAFYPAAYKNNRSHRQLMQCRGKSQEIVEVSDKPYKEHRGVTVQRSLGGFYYIHEGIIITERAGCTGERYKDIINDYHDSTLTSATTPYHAYESKQAYFKLGKELGR